jgi:hypothetical protein
MSGDMNPLAGIDSRFFESVLQRYLESLGALHPDQARRDFFVYACEQKGLSEAAARQWAKSQLERLVSRAAALGAADDRLADSRRAAGATRAGQR